MEVKVVRSQRRRRTIGARVVDGTMYVHVPVVISDKRLKEVIEDFKQRFKKRELKKQLNAREGLKGVVERLSRKYFGGAVKVKSIEYVANQNRRFGSCSWRDKTIRISHRLAEMPRWVRDYVIVHEMAHILLPNHSKAFWEIVSRYKLTERARGYLIAKGFEDEEESDVQDSDK